jgi:hypothetical protein
MLRRMELSSSRGTRGGQILESSLVACTEVTGISRKGDVERGWMSGPAKSE